MTRLRSLALLVSLTLAAVLSSSCARSSEEIAGDARGVRSVAAKSPASHATSKTVTNGVNTPTTSISNQELEARLLQFADAFKVPEDMSYTRLESALGMKLGPASEPASPWHVVKDVALADGYTFYATHFPAKKAFQAWRLRWLCPIPSTQRARRHPSAFGTRQRSRRSWRPWVTSAAGSALFQAGWLRQHWRSIDNGKQGFSVALLIYRTSQESGSRECAFGVQIDGGDV